LNRKLFTIGYIGFSLEAFIETLVRHSIECLIDVREIPISRKKGFSKSKLEAALANDGIEYRHFRSLGSPKALRHEVRESRDYDRFFSGVAAHLRTDSAQRDVSEVVFTSRRYRACLMCCCADWQYCHRKCVSDAIAERSHFIFDHLRCDDLEVLRRRAA
jgi:uncharacterized protein (DUF488 family)